MYFEFDDYRPDITPVGRAISWREGVLISIIVHLAVLVFMLAVPRLFPYDAEAARARARALLLQQQTEQAPRFVFVQPRLDVPAPKPPARAEDSDQDRLRRSPEQLSPTNPLPFSRGNTPERVEQVPQEMPRGQGPAPEPAAGQQAENNPPPETAKTQLPALKPPAPQDGANGRAPTSGGALGEALRNLQRYVQRDQLENQQGNGQFGPEIQFDTKGVEFGPWIRRFIAQVKRNWFIPYAAMSMRGHVVITFNVHKDGSITDLTVVGPCPIDSFNNAAFGALAASNPTQPLPPEYPSEKAFFTVTFFYNETPP